jgi:hypothetical protein
MESNRALIKRQIDRMIDYRRDQRPNDNSALRVSADAKEIHKALNLPDPDGIEARHAKDTDYPVSVLYRGCRLTSIPTERKLKALQAEKQRRDALGNPA